MSQRSWSSLIAVLLPGLAFLGPARAETGILLEAEHHDQTVGPADFARTTAEAAASGRHVLTRFFLDGYAVYRFAAPAAGTWRVWLRYGSKNPVKIGVAVDPAEEPDFQEAQLAATGGYVGPGVWGWSLLAEAELGAGAHAVALKGCTIRPDCLYLTTSTEPPTDDLVDPRQHIDPKLLPLLETPLDPIRPAWIEDAKGYQLPFWYEQHRVQAHTRLSLNWVDKPIFLTAGEAFRSMGAQAFTRHIKSGSEGAWWPSAVGAVAPQTDGRNLAKEILDEAAAAGCQVLVYSRHMEDARVAEQHPDWTQKQPDGSTYQGRGPKICFNSPYRDFVQQRLLELVDLGARAFYFDELHMEKAGCWCDYCRRGFKEATGLDLPKGVDPYDPIWLKLTEFTNRSIEVTFRQWRAALHAKNPETVLMIGSHTWPTMLERHLNNRLFRIADSMKTEFSLPFRTPGTAIYPRQPDQTEVERDVMIALGYALSRDACDGRPAHIWIHGLPNTETAVYAAAGVTAHGCIANLDVAEAEIPNQAYRPAFELGDMVSPYLAGYRPVKWAAVWYSECARDKRVLDPAAAWREVLHPTYGAYRALLRAHLPVGLVTDSQLADGSLDGYQVLIVPAPDSLTPEMSRAVQRFQEGGGLVILNQPVWRWHEPDGQAAASVSLLASLTPRLRGVPVKVSGGPEKLQAVSFRNGQGKLTIALTNDFTWVYTGSAKKNPPKPEQLTPPPPCEGVVVSLDGRPRRVTEVVTGQVLKAVVENDRTVVALPAFGPLAVLSVES